MNELFNFLNFTFEAGQTILNGRGKIIGYANDGYSISGVFALGKGLINYEIDDSDTPGDSHKYTLTLIRGEQSATYEHLYAKEIINLIKIGNLPIFQ